MNKKVIIIGATSGIGREVALVYIAQGWTVGVAGRREAELESLRAMAPEQVFTQVLDVTKDDAAEHLQTLIDKVGGMDLFLLSSGIGKQNYTLDTEIELTTAATNVEGFIRMTNAAYHYFEKQGHGHLAVISSIAGTKGLGAAAAYSATKGFQHMYMDALDQLSRMQKLNINFTDIRPGFVDTPLLANPKQLSYVDASPYRSFRHCRCPQAQETSSHHRLEISPPGRLLAIDTEMDLATPSSKKLKQEII